jgi:hypothetical protein
MPVGAEEGTLFLHRPADYKTSIRGRVRTGLEVTVPRGSDPSACADGIMRRIARYNRNGQLETPLR